MNTTIWCLNLIELLFSAAGLVACAYAIYDIRKLTKNP